MLVVFGISIKTLLLTDSGSGDAEGETTAGCWILVLSLKVVLQFGGVCDWAAVCRSGSIELIVSFTVGFDVFNKPMNLLNNKKKTLSVLDNKQIYIYDCSV